jgi:hypothetical protein
VRASQGCERLFHVCHEAGRAAKIDIRSCGKPTCSKPDLDKITGSFIAHFGRADPACRNKIAATAREGEHEVADFGRRTDDAAGPPVLLILFGAALKLMKLPAVAEALPETDTRNISLFRWD